MNLIFRLLRVVLAALLSSRTLEPLGTSVLGFRVWLNDIDTNLHMNNGRYFTIADLGRVDLMIRTGMLRMLFARKWAPVLGGAMIRFRRELKPFQPYNLKTRVCCWEGRWIYLEHIFETLDGHLAAVIVVKGVFLERGRSIDMSELMQAMGIHLESPPMPADIRAWQEAQQSISDRVKEG
ncbi:thioesterase family protein [Niveispirillum sp. KHB5.9]|uniref:thioesterase family protein n=1 Tax=Niveispirillum sp. KHB5.9 TaxID=3400269 RepID=UPI003A873993